MRVIVMVMWGTALVAGFHWVTSAPSNTISTVASVSKKLSIPDMETRFNLAIERGMAQFAAGVNDMQKGAARPQRASEICAALQTLDVDNWVGQIAVLSSNGDGKGVLSIRIGKNTYVHTWNNSLSDISDATLIEPGSTLFKRVASLKTGDWVTFSGIFMRSQTDCVRESSMSLSGSLTEPEFIFRFTGLSPI